MNTILLTRNQVTFVDDEEGYFVSPETAARTYDYAAVTLFGEYAKLNFPEEWTTEKIKRVFCPTI